MLSNDAPYGGLKVYQRGVIWTNIFGEIEKETFWRASVHYLIDAWLEKGGMLPNYTPWCGLEAY